MLTSLYEITSMNSYPIWCKSEDGHEAPMREMTFKDVTEDPFIDEVICQVYGIDAIKHYELGECVLVTLDIHLGFNEDETYKQVIRAINVRKVKMPAST